MFRTTILALFALFLFSNPTVAVDNFGSLLERELDPIFVELAKDSSPLSPDFGFFTISFEAGFGFNVPALTSAEIVPEIELTWLKLPPHAE